jgi:hypothetical protein
MKTAWLRVVGWLKAHPLIAAVVFLCLGVLAAGLINQLSRGSTPSPAPVSSTPQPEPSGPTNPYESRELSEVILEDPQDEASDERELERQIRTNLETTDPTYEHSVSCSPSSSYSHYLHFICEGFTTGKSSYGTVTVTVDTQTGHVASEEGLPGEGGSAVPSEEYEYEESYEEPYEEGYESEYEYEYGE